jgi:hypothetical protein
VVEGDGILEHVAVALGIALRLGLVDAEQAAELDGELREVRAFRPLRVLLDHLTGRRHRG